MSFSLDVHPENHFQLSDNQEGYGCCSCWKIFRRKPREYYVNENYELEGRRSVSYSDRIKANQRLCELIKYKLNPNDTTDANRLFERLKTRINSNMNNGDPISSEKLAKIINAIDELKKDLQDKPPSKNKLRKKARSGNSSPKKNPSL